MQLVCLSQSLSVSIYLSFSFSFLSHLLLFNHWHSSKAAAETTAFVPCPLPSFCLSNNWEFLSFSPSLLFLLVPFKTALLVSRSPLSLSDTHIGTLSLSLSLSLFLSLSLTQTHTHPHISSYPEWHAYIRSHTLTLQALRVSLCSLSLSLSLSTSVLPTLSLPPSLSPSFSCLISGDYAHKCWNFSRSNLLPLPVLLGPSSPADRHCYCGVNRVKTVLITLVV